MAKVSVYNKTSGKSSGAGYVDPKGKAFMITRAIMTDGGFAVTAWDDRPDEGTTKLEEGVYLGGTGETIRVYRNRKGTGASINTGIGGVLLPGRYRWSSEHKSRDEAGVEDPSPSSRIVHEEVDPVQARDHSDIPF